MLSVIQDTYPKHYLNLMLSVLADTYLQHYLNLMLSVLQDTYPTSCPQRSTITQLSASSQGQAGYHLREKHQIKQEKVE